MTPAGRWHDACAAADVVRGDGARMLVRGGGAALDRLIERIGPYRRLPLDADPAMLAGGIDALASLAAGRTIVVPAFLDRIAGATLLVTAADRLPAPLAAWLGAAIDRGEAPRLLLVADGDPVGAMLADRVDMIVDLEGIARHDRDSAEESGPAGAAIADPLAASAEAAAMMGIDSLRVPLATRRMADAFARLAGRVCHEADLARAARLVLAPRAARVDDDPPAAPSPPDPRPQRDGGEVAEMMVEAAHAAVPRDWLVAAASGRRGEGAAKGARGSPPRGPAGRIRRGRPAGGARLAPVATLLAAAPFQRLRGRSGPRPIVRPGDLRVRIPKPRSRAVTIFAVDASGSAALARLAEVKGAVVALLAESYARRDEVALIAFRGDTAQMLLPPTRSLARAQRELAGLPGGGATPLAAGIAAALDQGLRSRAADRAPHLLLLTDGGANVARDGTRGRAEAIADAAAAAVAVGASGLAATVVDTSRHGEDRVRRIAAAMAARYVALPRADEAGLARIARR